VGTKVPLILQIFNLASTYTRQVIKGMFDWVSMIDVTWSFLILEMSSFHIVFDWNDENEV
jgi:hypothetical protein